MTQRSDPPADAVAEYKMLLRKLIAVRPSGIRRKIAAETGTHPSFISQLTNPALRVPLPAQHIPAIFRICHFSIEEQRMFLDAYSRAHPAQFLAIDELAEIERNVIRISVPNFADSDFQVEIESLIRDFSERVIGLALRGQKK
jgi:DNA-binding transcriptional regulator YdaS (Cro superfamily)